jgi:hypothetical protein
VDTISFGPGRAPRRWRPGWLRHVRQPRRGGPGGRTWLVVAIAVTAGAATAIGLVTASGGGPRPVTARSPSVARSPSTTTPSPSTPSLSLLSGAPADGVSTDLFLDLDTGANAGVTLPAHWSAASETYPPLAASFDPSGRRFVLPLDRTDSSGNVIAEDLFVADTATGTLRMIPGQPPPQPSVVLATQPVQLAAAWDRQGLLWILAMNPDTGYYQLGSWTGGGPLRTLAPARGPPITLSPPGSAPR